MLKINMTMVCDGADNALIQRLISARLLDVAQFPLGFHGGESYLDCARETDIFRDTAELNFPGLSSREAAEEYLELCRLLDSDKPFVLNRAQRIIMRKLLSDYIESSEWVGADTAGEFPENAIIEESVRKSLDRKRAGIWPKAPKIYAEAEKKSSSADGAVDEIVRYFEDIRNYDKLLFGGRQKAKVADGGAF